MTVEFPPLYLLSTHLEPSELHSLEERIPSLTYDVHEAEIVVGNIAKRERALFELRRVKLDTEPCDEVTGSSKNADAPEDVSMSRSPKRRKLSKSHFQAEGRDDEATSSGKNMHGDLVTVLRLPWLKQSLAQGQMVPMDDFVLYRGRKLSNDQPKGSEILKQKDSEASISHRVSSKVSGAEILRRATEESASQPGPRHHAFGHSHAHGHSQQHPIPSLVHQTTSNSDEALPTLPSYLHTTYSCQRPTPVNSANGPFVDELKKIRTLRLLQGDQIGVRAYSTSIATLAACPHILKGPHDVARLPGCGAKIAVLYQQWSDNGQLDEVSNAASDPKLAVLQLFYDIWGVGDTTAREFHKKGWKDLDDLVEYAWGSLSRVQQIGVKYYDEFLLKIPRKEVEDIADKALAHARKIDHGFQMVIVGGYRRGKQQSGDVDIILSHPDEEKTLNLIEKLVTNLEKSKLITHTLSLSTRNSEREQMPLSWQGEGGRGSGFDTLDKALVVWQDRASCNTDGIGGSDNEALPPHRRVDIIISPWKTVGCAVLGWSGGTTFQRDIRRYCKKEKGLKFDSSGIRSREDGSWVDMEGPDGGWPDPAPDMETAERRVFAGLGLTYRPPEERCTG